MSQIVRDDATFLGDLARGAHAVYAVAARLAAAGLEVRIPEVRIRPHVAQREDYDDGGTDLYLATWPLQVKTKFGYQFDGLDDFRSKLHFDSVIVDSAEGIAKLQTWPAAYIITDARRVGMVVIPTNTRDRWTEKDRYDSTRGRTRRFVECPLELVVSIDDLITQAKRRLAERVTAQRRVTA